MTCGLCGRLTTVERLPRGWKVCGPLVFCRECLRQRYRLRSLTMSVGEPIGVQPEEFSVVLERARSPAAPLLLPDRAWELTTTEGHPIARVWIGSRWWELPLHCAHWSHGRKAAYQRIASGEALSGELLVYGSPASDAQVQDRPNRDRRSPPGILCKAMAWLPREPQRDLVRQRSALRARPSRPDPSVRNQDIREIDINNLRKAIHANWVSFPSQVPTFPSCHRPDLEAKVVQLYFVMGWSCTAIAARYGTGHQQVRCILNAWKCRATNAGYIQHIPPAEVMGELDDSTSPDASIGPVARFPAQEGPKCRGLRPLP